ncbi:flavin-containing amine oxidoreductase-domain containing protein [Thamnocephalis sphaerospora]|uniref:Flavin-containing amine oxidoreductase-domain containing protein n=1 Tax=Thamnocephalis sphaerospora TaxID=78915 RepID=A0A4P9XQ08_9FUNG|nr:flavin-containing amine oxidoreductase-domain containing protein [Thamnocephalis sphaerospora]|eukprot:RKP07982.1 flavin-containing amine oxidoreductase-domain containing protein [Thamnocephalis sphaerospora]
MLSSGQPVELGASLMHGVEDNPLVAIAAACSSASTLCLVPGPVTLIVPRPGGPVLSEAASGRLLMAVDDALATACAQADSLPALDVNLSVDAVLRPLLDSAAEQYGLDRAALHCAADVIAEDISAELSNAALCGINEEDELLGEDMFVAGGYTRVLEKLAGDALLSHVRLQHVVTHIDYSALLLSVGDMVQIATAEHGTFAADAVIITVPLGVLKAGVIQFTPPLSPQRQQAIECLGVGAHNKVILEFDHKLPPFWPLGYAFLTLRPADLEITDPAAAADVLPRESILFECMPTVQHSEHSRCEESTNPPTLIAYVHCSLAEMLEQRTDAEVADLFARHLACYFPQAPCVRPVRGMMSRWCQDIYARGSYSYIPVGSSAGSQYFIRASGGILGRRAHFADTAFYSKFVLGG